MCFSSLLHLVNYPGALKKKKIDACLLPLPNIRIVLGRDLGIEIFRLFPHAVKSGNHCHRLRRGGHESILARGLIAPGSW